FEGLLRFWLNNALAPLAELRVAQDVRKEREPLNGKINRLVSNLPRPPPDNGLGIELYHRLIRVREHPLARRGPRLAPRLPQAIGDLLEILAIARLCDLQYPLFLIRIEPKPRRARIIETGAA